MSIRMLLSGPAADLQAKQVDANDIVDMLTITITSLSLSKPRADFDKGEYLPAHNSVVHPFDIDYRKSGTFQVGKFLRVLIRLEPKRLPGITFIPPMPDEAIKNPAVTTANALAAQMLCNLEQATSGLEVSFLIQELDIPANETPKRYAAFNLGFRIPDDEVDGAFHDFTYDPTVPNDGS